MKRNNKEKLLLLSYLLITALYVFPALDIMANTIILGIPIALIWMLGCLILIIALTLIAKVFVFKPWMKEIDKSEETES
ncbi:hypothetical protein ACFLZV_07200 [Candidatus Margulisiibacteriota bacterium]